MRSRVLDPLSGREMPPGERGVLAHCDLANFNSAIAILTEDVGIAVDGGFLLLGRAEGAAAKGCSLAVQEFLEASRVHDRSAGALAICRAFAPGEVCWQTLHFAAHGSVLDVEVPLLDDAQMQTLAAHVRAAARARLQPMPVDAVIAMIDRAVARLLDANDPVRREADALLPLVTGFDAEMVRLGLTAYLQTFRAPQLHRFVAQDFANPKVLDGFQPALKGGAVRAFGPALLAHVLGRQRAGPAAVEPGLRAARQGGQHRQAAERRAGVRDPVRAAALRGASAAGRLPCDGVVERRHSPGPRRRCSANADTVLAYGGNAALHEVREQVPVTTRFLGYGHKLGLALVGRAALDRQRGPATARQAALDVVR